MCPCALVDDKCHLDSYAHSLNTHTHVHSGKLECGTMPHRTSCAGHCIPWHHKHVSEVSLLASCIEYIASAFIFMHHFKIEHMELDWGDCATERTRIRGEGGILYLEDQRETNRSV